MVSTRPIRASSFVIGLANLSMQDLSCQRSASHSRAFSSEPESDRRLRRTVIHGGSVLDLTKGIDWVGDESLRHRETVVVVSSRYGEISMNIWTEFKNAVLPWLLAGAVVSFMIAEHRRTTAALVDANTRLASAVEQQGKALDGIRALLASQGYTLPPLTKPQ